MCFRVKSYNYFVAQRNLQILHFNDDSDRDTYEYLHLLTTVGTYNVNWHMAVFECLSLIQCALLLLSCFNTKIILFFWNIQICHDQLTRKDGSVGLFGTIFSIYLATTLTYLHRYIPVCTYVFVLRLFRLILSIVEFVGWYVHKKYATLYYTPYAEAEFSHHNIKHLHAHMLTIRPET